MHNHASVDIFLRKHEKHIMSICVDVHLVIFMICFKMKPLKLANKNIKIVMSLSETIEKRAYFK